MIDFWPSLLFVRERESTTMTSGVRWGSGWQRINALNAALNGGSVVMLLLLWIAMMGGGWWCRSDDPAFVGVPLRGLEALEEEEVEVSVFFCGTFNKYGALGYGVCDPIVPIDFIMFLVLPIF